MALSILRSSWLGFDKIKHLIIFGDSYSDVGYRAQSRLRPTAEEPLGVAFPGTTWNEYGEPNWVGHLLTARKDEANHSLIVYDYAIGGHDIAGVRQQIRLNYLDSVGKKPDWAPWTAQDSLFVTWVGINDCSMLYPYPGLERFKSYQKNLFEGLKQVYDTGARNFLFIDVPPMERAPGLSQANTDARAAVYEGWNTALRTGATKFAEDCADATVMLFSSHELFQKVLDDPEQFDFDKKTANEESGCIWFDHIHITSQMHSVVAYAIMDFLASQSPSEVSRAEGSA